jgi:CBS domain containing-hemolysin-like protein
MVSVYTEVEVDVDISEFDTEDLIDELESRGALQVDGNIDAKELVEKIWLKRRLGNHNYQDELDKLIYSVLGKIV